MAPPWSGQEGEAAGSKEVAALREQLARKEEEMEQMTRSWQDRLARSELRKQEEARLLEVRLSVCLPVCLTA